MVNEQILQARKELVQQIMDKIRDNRDFARFYEHVQVVFTHIGLYYTPEMQDFLNSRNWDNPIKFNDYIKDIKVFLAKIIN